MQTGLFLIRVTFAGEANQDLLQAIRDSVTEDLERSGGGVGDLPISKIEASKPHIGTDTSDFHYKFS